MHTSPLILLFFCEYLFYCAWYVLVHTTDTFMIAKNIKLYLRHIDICFVVRVKCTLEQRVMRQKFWKSTSISYTEHPMDSKWIHPVTTERLDSMRNSMLLFPYTYKYIRMSWNAKENDTKRTIDNRRRKTEREKKNIHTQQPMSRYLSDGIHSNAYHFPFDSCCCCCFSFTWFDYCCEPIAR